MVLNIVLNMVCTVEYGEVNAVAVGDRGDQHGGGELSTFGVVMVARVE